MFFCSGFASGRRLRMPANGYDRRNEKVSLTVGRMYWLESMQTAQNEGQCIGRGESLTFVGRSSKLRRQRLES